MAGALVVHLGMSGGLRVVCSMTTSRSLHGHVDIEMQNGPWLRYNDHEALWLAVFTLRSSPAGEPLAAEPVWEWNRFRETNFPAIISLGNIA